MMKEDGKIKINFINLALSSLSEVLFLFLYILAGVLGFIIKLSSVNAKPTKPYPIVFVHGWLTQNPLYYLLKKYLEHCGFCVYMTDFGLQLGDFNKLAIKLDKFVQTKQLKNIVLVGVSGGAIISFVYLQDRGGWKNVRKYISIGGPYKGAPLAVLAAFFSKAAKQMLPKSTFVIEQLDKGMENTDKIINITAKYDFIVPPKYSQIHGSKNVVVDLFGHVRLQAFSKEVYKIIADEAEK